MLPKTFYGKSLLRVCLKIQDWTFIVSNDFSRFLV